MAFQLEDEVHQPQQNKSEGKQLSLSDRARRLMTADKFDQGG
jgi:hypothetical protein